MAGEKAARINTQFGILAHSQDDKEYARRVNATELGELLVSNGAKSSSITYTGAGLVDEIVLTYEVNGADVTKTITFSYDGASRMSGHTVVIS